MNLTPERWSTERKCLHTEFHLKADMPTQGPGPHAKTLHAVLPLVPTLTIFSLRSKIIAKAVTTTDYEKDVACFLVGLYLFTYLKILNVLKVELIL